MASWAEVVAEITFQVNKAAAAKEVETAVAGAKPVATVGVDEPQVGQEVSAAVRSAKPVAQVGVDEAQVTGEVDTAIAASHGTAPVGVNEGQVTEEVDAAVAASHGTAQVNVNEPKITEEIDQAAAAAHPTIAPAVNKASTGAAVTEAVEKSPPATVPINAAGTGKQVEEGIKSADTGKAGAEGGEKYKSGFAAPVTALKGMVMGAVGAEAIMGGQQLFTALITQAGAASKATKVVTEAIKTTGGGAGITAEQIDKMAGAQARATGIDKTAIQQSDALLLRYTGIKNAAGANNAIFDRTSQAALDMTAALNKGVVTEEGLTSTTKLLGKALEDPAKAAGVLRKSGIDLSKAQQDQIKTFEKNNDTLGAQKVVLDAVNASYGGTAANVASGGAKMKASLQELEATLGKVLLPLFSSLIKVLGQVLDAIAPMAEWFGRGGTAATILKDVIFGLIGAIALFMGTVKAVKLATDAYALSVDVVKSATNAWKVAQEGLDVALDANVIGLIVVAVAALSVGIYELYKHSQLFRDIVHDTWGFISGVATGAAHAFTAAIRGVGDAVAWIGRLFGGLNDQITGFIGTWTTSSNEFTGIFSAMFNMVTFYAKRAAETIFGPFRDAIDAIENLFHAGAAVITGIWRAEWALLAGVFRAGAAILTGIWKAEWDIMVAVLKTFAAAVLAVLRILVDTIRGILKVGFELITGQWGAAWQTMKGTVSAVTGDITGFIHSATGAWGEAIGQAGRAMGSALSSALSDMRSGARSAMGDITGALSAGAADMRQVLSDLAGAWSAGWREMESASKAGWSGIKSVFDAMTHVITGLPDMFGSVVHGVASLWGGLREAIHGPIAWAVNVPIEGMIKVFNTVGGSIHLPRIPDVSMAAEGMRVTQGTTPTADDVLVRVSRDETIVSAAHSRFLAPVFTAIGVPGYQGGGVPSGGSSGGGLAGLSSLTGGLVQAIRAALPAVTATVASGQQVITSNSATRAALASAAQTVTASGQQLITSNAAATHMSGVAADQAQQAAGASNAVIKVAARLIPMLSTATHMSGVAADLGEQVVGADNAVIEVAAKVLAALAKAAGAVSGARLFAGGGLISEPVSGVGQRSGARYLFGEAGPEWVVPGFAIGGLVSGVISGAGRALSDAEGAVANAARDAAHLAGSVYSDVVNGVVHVAGLAVDAGQMASDLAVSEFRSLESGFGQLGGLEAAGATGWVKDVTKGVTKEIAGASVSHLKGFAGVAAKVLDEGGWLMPGQLGYNGTGRPELFLPGYQLGGLVGAGLPDLSTMSISAGGQTWTLAGLAQQMQTAAKDNSAMTAQLQRIGALLQSNPQAVADAIAQALNGVARLASSGAFYTTR